MKDDLEKNEDVKACFPDHHLAYVELCCQPDSPVTTWLRDQDVAAQSLDRTMKYNFSKDGVVASVTEWLATRRPRHVHASPPWGLESNSPSLRKSMKNILACLEWAMEFGCSVSLELPSDSVAWIQIPDLQKLAQRLHRVHVRSETWPRSGSGRKQNPGDWTFLFSCQTAALKASSRSEGTAEEMRQALEDGILSHNGTDQVKEEVTSLDAA